MLSGSRYCLFTWKFIIFVIILCSVILYYINMTTESRNSSLLSNDSVNRLPRKWTRATIGEWCFCGRTATVAMQLHGKHASSTIVRLCFLPGPCPGITEGQRRWYELVEFRSSKSAVSRELRSSKITNKRWQRGSWQLKQRIRLRIPELAVGKWWSRACSVESWKSGSEEKPLCVL
jgi:hypothetical protein